MLKKLFLILWLLTMGAIAGVLMGFAIKNRADDDALRTNRIQLALTLTAASLAIASALFGLFFLLAKMLHIPWIDFVWLTITSLALWFAGCATGYWIRRIQQNGPVNNPDHHHEGKGPDPYDRKELTEFILLCILSFGILVPLIIWPIKAMRDYLRRSNPDYAGSSKRTNA